MTAQLAKTFGGHAGRWDGLDYDTATIAAQQEVESDGIIFIFPTSYRQQTADIRRRDIIPDPPV